MRPVWARARRSASMVASLPVFAKRTASAVGTMRRNARRLRLRRVWRRRSASLRRSLGDRFDNLWVGVALDGRAEGHHEVDVFVAVEVPDVGAAAFFDYDWTVFVDCLAARWGVHAFDQ